MHVFEVLADPVRRRILELLGPGEMASGEVVEAIGAEFGITQAAVSQHLKVLRESGFARVRAEAQRRLYSVDAAGLQAVDEWIGDRKSTRLNSSHRCISYAVFCLKKKKHRTT